MTSALEADWLGLCRSAVTGIRAMLDGAGERFAETGEVGSGGDRTLVIDSAAEQVVFDGLDALHALGARFSVLSEERGSVSYGSDDVLVIVDPIDGSLNAKRGLPHHALSVAVASGETMADVEFAYVYDFGPREEWRARRGSGAWLNDALLDPLAGERRGRDGRLEVLGIESADPRWIAGAIDRLVDSAYRLRALGTIAASLCQVAAARFDGMVSLKRCRGVDAAAGQLIVREAGGFVDFPGSPALSAPLDAVPVSPVVAARSEQTLAALAGVPW
jgi:myo-inositol-1(or 4)-monophosphatase